MNTYTELHDHPVFICGHPKSGTSLLRAILDSHSQLVVYPEETIFFRRFLPRAKSLDRQGQLDLANRYLIHIFSWNRELQPPSQAGFLDRDYSAISYEAVRCQMRELVESNYRHEGDILSSTILAFGKVSGQISSSTRYWVEKSPYNEYHTEKIFGWWPEAHCIHIVRDPRDNYASYHLKHPEWSAEFFSTNWNRSTNAGIQNRELYGNSRYLILRYEDLVQSPEKSLRQLIKFLGIQWSASLSNPTRAGEQWKGNSMFTDRFQGISAAPVSRWKENLAFPDAAIIEQMTGYYLDYFQYPHQTLNNMPFFEALDVHWHVQSWPIRRQLLRFQRGSSRSIRNHDQTDENIDDDTLND